MRKNFRLTEAQIADARESIALLEGTNMSLVAAVRLALRLDDSPRAQAGTLISAAEESFCAAALRRNRREKTVRGYREQLQAFADAHEEQTLDSITRPALKAYLLGLKLAPGSKMSRMRAVRAMYRWARRQNPPLCATDPTMGLSLELPHVDRKIKCLPPETCERIMHLISLRWRDAAALALFAGIRPEELGKTTGKEQLAWEMIDMEARIIRVPAEVAKTRAPRIIEDLPTPLWDWLKLTPAAKRKGVVCPGTRQSLLDNMRSAGGLGKRGASKWIFDGPRHSFASYTLALTGDSGKVCIWMGHEGKPTVLYRRYRAICTKAEAVQFMGIKPEVIPQWLKDLREKAKA